ncbi:MAG TPA: OsmC family protein [Longimicrobiales bacterium]|nr:OsmC family protein [Longimicrobiales bacterium]
MSTSEVRLRWRGDGLVFLGGAPGGPEIALDSDGKAGPSPTQALLLALAGCMGVDVRMILEKSRVPLEALDVLIEADRVEEPPRRFHAIRLTYRLRGPREDDRPKVDRAVELSRDKYCSVLHTLRPDLELDIHVELT